MSIKRVRYRAEKSGPPYEPVARVEENAKNSWEGAGINKCDRKFVARVSSSRQVTDRCEKENSPLLTGDYFGGTLSPTSLKSYGAPAHPERAETFRSNWKH